MSDSVYQGNPDIRIVHILTNRLTYCNNKKIDAIQVFPNESDHFNDKLYFIIVTNRTLLPSSLLRMKLL